MSARATNKEIKCWQKNKLQLSKKMFRATFNICTSLELCIGTQKTEVWRLFPKFFTASIIYIYIVIKEIVERRHGEPIKFIFLPKMGLLGSQAGNEKNCWSWILSNFLGPFFHVFMGKFCFVFQFFLQRRVCTKKLLGKIFLN
jgi:hypothetical protein